MRNHVVTLSFTEDEVVLSSDDHGRTGKLCRCKSEVGKVEGDGFKDAEWGAVCESIFNNRNSIVWFFEEAVCVLSEIDSSWSWEIGLMTTIEQTYALTLE
jgi:hypothetical protein